MINKLFSTQQQQSLFPSCLYFILSFVFLKATSSTPSPRPLPRPSSPPLIRLSMSPLVPVTFYHVCLCASIWALKRFATTLSRFNWQPVCLYTNVCVCVCVRLVRRCLSPAVFTIDKRQHWQHRRFRFPPRSFSMTFLRCIYSNLLTLLYCSEKVSIKHRHTHTHTNLYTSDRVFWNPYTVSKLTVYAEFHYQVKTRRTREVSVGDDRVFIDLFCPYFAQHFYWVIES